MPMCDCATMLCGVANFDTKLVLIEGGGRGGKPMTRLLGMNCSTICSIIYDALKEGSLVVLPNQQQ